MRLLTALLAFVVLALAPASAQGAVSVVSVIPFSAVEGDRIRDDQFIARFNETGACAAGAYTITVTWGDGTASGGEVDRTEQIPSIGGLPQSCNYDVVGEHQYRTAGSYALGVTVCRDGCASGANTVAITEAAMKGEAFPVNAVAGQAFTGEVAEFNDDNRLAQPSDFTAVVDWGDGTTSPGVIGGKDGRFDVSGQHVYASAGTYLVRVTLLQGGVPRVTSDPRTANVGPPGSATRIVANSVVAPPSLRPATLRPRATLRMRTVSIRRRSLRRGLPIRLSAPATTRSVRISILRSALPRTLGRVTLRLRGGRVANGVRVANLRVRLSARLRSRMRPGVYTLRFRIGNDRLVSARFRVRR
jgi:hypothetical protein